MIVLYTHNQKLQLLVSTRSWYQHISGIYIKNNERCSVAIIHTTALTVRLLILFLIEGSNYSSASDDLIKMVTRAVRVNILIVVNKNDK